MSEVKHIGRKINILSNKIKRRIGRVSAEYGVTSSQAKIVGFIYRQSSKRDIFQRDIEEEFDIRRSSVTSVITLMEKNGFIKRVSVCEDARLKKLILTDKGIELHNSVYKEIEAVEGKIVESLSEAEFNIFTELVERLIKEIVD